MDHYCFILLFSSEFFEKSGNFVVEGISLIQSCFFLEKLIAGPTSLSQNNIKSFLGRQIRNILVGMEIFLDTDSRHRFIFRHIFN